MAYRMPGKQLTLAEYEALPDDPFYTDEVRGPDVAFVRAAREDEQLEGGALLPGLLMDVASLFT
jgi:hypothetical protein